MIERDDGKFPSVIIANTKLIFSILENIVNTQEVFPYPKVFLFLI